MGVYVGTCFCGAVGFEATGEPAVQGYCHCHDCRRWLGAPVNAFTLWEPNRVKVVKGIGSIGSFSKTPRANRIFCKACGGAIMVDLPGYRLTEVLSSVLARFTHQPTLHINYSSRQLDMPDGLPKYRDLPASFGGSDELVI